MQNLTVHSVQAEELFGFKCKYLCAVFRDKFLKLHIGERRSSFVGNFLSVGLWTLLRTSKEFDHSDSGRTQDLFSRRVRCVFFAKPDIGRLPSSATVTTNSEEWMIQVSRLQIFPNLEKHSSFGKFPLLRSQESFHFSLLFITSSSTQFKSQHPGFHHPHDHITAEGFIWSVSYKLWGNWTREGLQRCKNDETQNHIHFGKKSLLYFPNDNW